MLNRNLATLVTAQLISASGSITAVQLGPIVGTALAPDPGIGTLPLSFMVIGTALAAAPPAQAMQRVGRRAAFLAGAHSGAA
ncbi:MAG: MFS transporter, partial [Pseudomonadota bacterium]